MEAAEVQGRARRCSGKFFTATAELLGRSPQQFPPLTSKGVQATSKVFDEARFRVLFHTRCSRLGGLPPSHDPRGAPSQMALYLRRAHGGAGRLSSA